MADFSLSPLFRRQWSSVYEALQDCRPNRQKLMQRYIEEIPKDKDELLYVTVAIDHTLSPRVGEHPILEKRKNLFASSNRE